MFIFPQSLSVKPISTRLFKPLPTQHGMESWDFLLRDGGRLGAYSGCGGRVGWRFGGDGGADERSEGGNEVGRIVERGHHLELLDAGGERMLACFDIDLVQRFDVFGDE